MTERGVVCFVAVHSVSYGGLPWRWLVLSVASMLVVARPVQFSTGFALVFADAVVLPLWERGGGGSPPETLLICLSLANWMPSARINM